MYYLARRDARVSARGGKRLAHTHTRTYVHTHTRTCNAYIHTCMYVCISMYTCACVLTPTRLHALRTVHTRANGESVEHADIPSLRVYAVCGKLRNKVEPPCDRGRRQRVRLSSSSSSSSSSRRAVLSRGIITCAPYQLERTYYTKGTFVKGEYRKMRAAAMSKTHERARRSPGDYLASRPFLGATSTSYFLEFVPLKTRYTLKERSLR